jgi:hypothetical protein
MVQGTRRASRIRRPGDRELEGNPSPDSPPEPPWTLERSDCRRAGTESGQGGNGPRCFLCSLAAALRGAGSQPGGVVNSRRRGFSGCRRDPLLFDVDEDHTSHRGFDSELCLIALEDEPGEALEYSNPGPGGHP